jgi:hypothetical protein
MESEAYKLGTLDAALELGITKEAWAKAVLPALGAATGAMLAPEGERAQGAVLGGLGALGTQAAVGAGARKLVNLGSRAKTFLTPKPNPHAPTPGGKQMAQTANLPEHLADLTHWNRQERMFDRTQDMLKRETAQNNAELSRLNPAKPAPTISPQTIAESKRLGTDPALVTAMMNAPKQASLAQFKLSADISMGMGIPGTPVSIGLKDQRERLPGMGYWVPRSTLERGFQYVDQGVDPETITALEAEKGTLLDPAVGAALGTVGALKFIPKSGIVGPLLAGLTGAGLGASYNRLTRDRRIAEGIEALRGAQYERERFPVRQIAHPSANESTPLVVSGGHEES